MGTRGELECNGGSWVAGDYNVADVSSSASDSSGVDDSGSADEYDRGLWVAVDNSVAGECDVGVRVQVFRCGGVKLEFEGREPDSISSVS